MIPTHPQALQAALSGPIPSSPVGLPINEVFGATFQGEGPHTGRRCWFVRVGYCNLSCSWCDTPYTWDGRRYSLKDENPPTPIDTVLDRLADAGANPGSMVVISGGEPLLWRTHLYALTGAGTHEWHVETNGTKQPPDWWADRITHTTVSPKIAQDDDPHRKRIVYPALAMWAGLAERDLAAFKFVARDTIDLGAIAAVVDVLGLDDRHVWVMPEGTTATKVLATQRAIAERVLDRGWNLSTRMHTLLWDDERGR